MFYYCGALSGLGGITGCDGGAGPGSIGGDIAGSLEMVKSGGGEGAASISMEATRVVGAYRHMFPATNLHMILYLVAPPGVDLRVLPKGLVFARFPGWHRFRRTTRPRLCVQLLPLPVMLLMQVAVVVVVDVGTHPSSAVGTPGEIGIVQ